MLRRLVELRLNDLQLRQYLGAAFTAAEHAGIGQVADNSPDRGMVPRLARSGAIPEVIQIAGDPLNAEAFLHILFNAS